MDVVDGGEQVAAALAGRLEQLTFADLTADEVTARIIDAVVSWAAEQGWRVYRRAPSVLPLPPPMSDRYSVLDVACARPAGPPVVIEVDHTDRRRTVDKLIAEAGAGRAAIWIRWGIGGFVPPPPPVHMVTCEVARHQGAPGRGRLYSRPAGRHRPPPMHSAGGAGSAAAVALPIDFTDPQPLGFPED